MSANDGAVLAFRQLMNNGANNLRYNIVLVSDGYTAADIPLFRSHCKGFARKLFWTAPFSSLRCTFNVFALEVSSTETGIDDPLTCGDGTTGSGAKPATFFDSTLCGEGDSRRVISLDSGLVRNRVAGFLPQAHAMFVLVNKSFHAGNQGDVVALTTEPGWEDSALHEFGHVLGLADEYGYRVSQALDGGRTYEFFDALSRGFGLPDEPNVTPGGGRAGLKWGAMVASTTPVPTTPGSVPAGTVGMFESAKYYDFGLYRPEEICAMRTSVSPFCGVCRAAITQALVPWTPTTTCVTPTATPASLTVDARIRSKVMMSPGRGGYEVTLDTTTNLPVAPTYRLDGGAWTALPATRTIQVPINQSPGTYIYNHFAEVRAQVSVEDLDYWVPGTSTFTTAQGSDSIALRQPNNAANVIGNDYGNAANVEGTGYAAINFSGGLVAGNGWLFVGIRKYYTRLAARLQLDPGYFGPHDDPAWGLQNITWTPTPSQSAGVTVFYDFTFDSSGLCWLNSDPATVVDPNVGFSISAKGNDAIGQSFSATGWLVPTNVEYRRSISTIQIAKIPKWEWPVLFDIRGEVLEVVLNGISVTLSESVIQIGKLKVKLQDART